jgi:ribonuclease R
MLNGRLGYELKCIITGITSFGVFLQCSKYGVEGLIKIDNLGEDYWQVNEKKHIIMGKRSGVELRLGQPMNAKILSVDIPARKLELAPAQPLTRRGRKKKSKGKNKKNKKKNKSGKSKKSKK